MIFDRATATAAMSKGSITTATILPAADQKFLWILEFSCSDGRRERMTRARKSIVKTDKTCDAASAEAHAIGMREAFVQLN